MNKSEYLETFNELIRPLQSRSGMVINSPFKYLASKKKLMIVGYNPGGVPDTNETTIAEDWMRHTSDENFNALTESWGQHQTLIAGSHPIQRFYQAIIDSSDLTEEDILYTNMYWQRSKSIADLTIDPILEEQCKEGFLLNLIIHQPESICFLGHKTHDQIVKDWSELSFPCGAIDYPWGETQSIKLYRMKFQDFRVKAFSVPHPSRFGIGNDPDRLDAILQALDRSRS